MKNQFVPKGVARDLEEKVRLEARNGVIQADFILSTCFEAPSSNKITPQLLKKRQELDFRDGEVTLTGAQHQPPDHSDVPKLVDEMCTYLREQWSGRTAVHLAAYAMWRVNWIHPIFGGNGRSARAFS